MKYLFSGAFVFSDGKFRCRDFEFTAGAVSDEKVIVVNSSDYYIFPGFTDVHVHFREPGFSYKETIKSGSLAAAHGGYTAVCTMPNLSPSPDCPENLKIQTDIIKKDAIIEVLPYGTITRGELGHELSCMEELAPFVCGYSDDGRGVDDAGLMREAMRRSAALGKIIAAHCEASSEIKDSPKSEWREVERDLKLAYETGCKLHICHISTEESVSLIRDAKASGVDVTCETAPHYLMLTVNDRLDNGRYKMNPPLRGTSDRDALLYGIYDGTIDMIATDHAPHSADEKNSGFEKSLNGVVGLETAFPVLYTWLVQKSVIPLEKLIELMSTNPSKRFGIKNSGFTVFNTKDEYMINNNDFYSAGKSTPFDGMRVFGRCIMTVYNNNIAYIDKKILK